MLCAASGDGFGLKFGVGVAPLRVFARHFPLPFRSGWVGAPPLLYLVQMGLRFYGIVMLGEAVKSLRFKFRALAKTPHLRSRTFAKLGVLFVHAFVASREFYSCAWQWLASALPARYVIEQLATEFRDQSVFKRIGVCGVIEELQGGSNGRNTCSLEFCEPHRYAGVYGFSTCEKVLPMATQSPTAPFSDVPYEAVARVRQHVNVMGAVL